MPMPASRAVSVVSALPGVIRVQPRIWGIVRCVDRPVTAMGVKGEKGRPYFGLFVSPRIGEAVCGSVAAQCASGGSITVRLVATLDVSEDLVAADLVLLHPEDARRLMDLPAEQIPTGWQIAADPRTPSVRTVHQAYAAGENYTTVIDGFLLSPDLSPTVVATRDLQFEYTDHHPVVLEVQRSPHVPALQTKGD